MVEDNFSSDIEDKALNPKFERLGYKDQVLDIINSLKLISDTDKSILKSRFLYEVLNYDARRNHTKKYYNGFRFIVTVDLYYYQPSYPLDKWIQKIYLKILIDFLIGLLGLYP